MLFSGIDAVGQGNAPRADDWPQWLGPERDGHSRETILAPPWPDTGLPLLWESHVGIGFSGCSVAEGRLYTMGNEDDRDAVQCLDAASGRVLWRHEYPCELGPKYYEGGPGSTPTVDGDQVFTISKWGHVHCLDARTGEVRWTRDLRDSPGLKPNEWGYAGSALVQEKAVYFNAAGAGLALDRRTGEVLWFNGTDSTGYASPVLATFAGQSQLLIFAARRLLAVHPVTGRELWDFPWETGYDNNNADPIVLGNRVFITSYDRGCALLEPRATGVTAVYANESLQTHMAQPVRVGEHLYGFSGHYARRPELRCVHWPSGRLAWAKTGVAAGSLLVVADDHLLALFGDGQLAVLEATPTEYRERSRVRVLTGRCWTPPSLSQGRLYVRNAKGTLRCLRIGDDR